MSIDPLTNHSAPAFDATAAETAGPAAYTPAPLGSASAVAPGPGVFPRSAVVEPVRHNLFAILSFAAAFLVPVAGIVFGHVSLRQIARTREAGRGFALAGLWIGYAAVALTALFAMIYVGLIFIFIAAGFASTYPPAYAY